MLLFDEALVSRQFGQSATEYDKAASIQQQMIDLALSMLDSQPFSFHTMLDIGCGTGNAFSGLSERFPTGIKLGIDIAFPMLSVAQQKSQAWRTVCANMNMLPIKDASIDLIFSTAALQWANDTKATLAEWYRVLKPGGCVCLGSFGQQSLHELREVFKQVDHRSHTHPLMTHDKLHQIARQSGFILLNEQNHQKKEYYCDFFDILQYLKTIGATLATSNRHKALTGKRRFAQASIFYEHHREAEGLPVSWEMILMLLQKPVSE